MKIPTVLFMILFVLASCNENKEKENNLSASADFNANTTGSSVAAKDDFSDLKKKDDESCEDKTVEDIEKELKKKAEMAQKSGTGFSFNSGEPGCDPNEEAAKN